MNEKLLNLYLQILISLLIGDLIVGGIWLVRYNNILKTLKSDLSYQIDNDYGFDPNFQVSLGWKNFFIPLFPNFLTRK